MDTLRSILLVLSLPLAAGCAKCSSSQVTPRTSWEFQSYVRSQPAGVTAKGRLFYSHGLYQSIDIMRTEATYAIVPDALFAAGYEIVYLGYPILGPEDFIANGGKAYAASFQRFVRDLNASLPAVPVTVTGGTSFGGLHSVWAAEAIGAQVTFANLAVTQVSALKELAGLDTHAVDMAAQSLPDHMWLSWGAFDDRVNGELTASQFAGLPDLREYQTAHTATEQQMADILAWLASQGIR